MHPDKPNGNNELFLTVQQSMDELKQMIQTMQEPYDFWSETENQLDELDENIEKVSQQFQELAEQIKQSDIQFAHNGTLVEEYAQSSAEYAQSSAEYAQSSAEYARSSAEYARSSAEYARSSAEYAQSFQEYAQSFEEYRAHTEAFSTQRKEDYAEILHNMDHLTAKISYLSDAFKEFEEQLDAQDAEQTYNTHACSINEQPIHPYRMFSISTPSPDSEKIIKSDIDLVKGYSH